MLNPQSAAIAALLAFPVMADAQDTQEDNQTIEEMIVLGRSVNTASSRIEVEREMLVDTATALKDIPGANVNRNGLITGIAQYRGMFGDRVTVGIDSLGIISGGPNAMDSPLSYMSPMITEELIVDRGIASVSRAPESIGGFMNTRLARGEFNSGRLGLSGNVGTRYADNGDVSTTAGRLTAATDRHRVSLVTEIDSGNDLSTPEGRIRPSGINRERYDLSYAFGGDDTEFMIHAGRLDTTDTGTPALPMDIRFIETDIYGARLTTAITETIAIEARYSFNDVEHLMDNFTLRAAPMPPMFRQNYTTGTGSQFYLAGNFELAESELRIGIDGILAEHESTITNPNNPAFRVDNFVDVQRDVLSMFAEWTRDFGESDVEFGLRYKQVETSAGEVGAMGMPDPMGMNVGMLAEAFNAAERDLDWGTVDAVFKYRADLSDNAEWILELGSKTRAPAYQELYLWLPLQATGGLADGRTYIGDLTLDAERSNEIVLGLTSSLGELSLSPQIFYRDVSDYIQGTPSTNMMASMISTMMSGQPALQFSNVDAEIWGADIAWKYQLSDRWFVDGIASYIRGRRTDVSDNLYRLAPLNGSIGLTYAAANWSVKPELVVYAEQDKVSAFNNEQPTPGYEIVNVAFAWNPLEALRLEARVDNLLDESYQDHLTGINRAMGSDIPVGTRLFGVERTISAGFSFSF